jgi:hypothetical protein
MEAEEISHGVKMSALNEILKRVTDRRTIVEFTIAEKIQKTYRIQSGSWKQAKEKIARSDDNGCYDDDLMDGDFYNEVDGSWQYIQSYAPRYERKIRQLKIGYRWFDLDELESDPLYYLEVIERWD